MLRSEEVKLVSVWKLQRPLPVPVVDDGVGQVVQTGNAVKLLSVMLLTIISLVFWLKSASGIEGGYFGLTEFSRLPREALRGVAAVAQPL